MAAITKIGLGVVLAASGWVAALFGLGFIAGGWVGDGVEERLAESFAASASVGSTDVGLIRGRVEIDQVQLIRADSGHLRMRVGRADARIAPGGLALVDRDIREIRLRDVDLEVSAWGALEVPPGQHEPVSAGAIFIEDARFAFVPTELVPGWGRFELTIEHARSRATTLRTPVSWLFTLEQLTAQVDLPAGVTVHVEYAGGRLRASGAVFGSKPVEIPVTIPVPLPGKEVEQLLTLGQDIVRKLTVERAGSWIERQLIDRILK